jgi:hypothetical protein
VSDKKSGDDQMCDDDVKFVNLWKAKRIIS